jgi:hypothetical protein
VRRYHGLIDNKVFLHELDRARGASAAAATLPSPVPIRSRWRHSATIRPGAGRAERTGQQCDGGDLNAAELAAGQQLPVEDAQVAAWVDWGTEYAPAAVHAGDAIALGLDPHLAVLITHGLFDLVTPYLATQLLLDQVPEAELGSRIRLSVYPGGHMFYTNDASRAALRDEASRLFGRR